MFNVRPIKRFVLLLDDQDETVQDGIIVNRGPWAVNMDYYVVRVGTDENVDFGQGDRVVLEHPDRGRRLKLDGVPYRLVRVSDIIGVIE